MTSYREWVSNLVDAVRHKDSRALFGRLDWNDHMAQTIAMSQQPTMPQLQQQSGEKFRFLNSAISESWATFAAAHMGAKVAAQAGRKQVLPLLPSTPHTAPQYRTAKYDMGIVCPKYTLC